MSTRWDPVRWKISNSNGNQFGRSRFCLGDTHDIFYRFHPVYDVIRAPEHQNVRVSFYFVYFFTSVLSRILRNCIVSRATKSSASSSSVVLWDDDDTRRRHAHAQWVLIYSIITRVNGPWMRDARRNLFPNEERAFDNIAKTRVHCSTVIRFRTSFLRLTATATTNRKSTRH